MAAFGKTPLTRAVSDFAGSFNQTHQEEMANLYATPEQQAQMSARQVAEDNQYKQARENALQKVMGDMIRADSGMDGVGCEALARMMPTPDIPAPITPTPPPPQGPLPPPFGMGMDQPMALGNLGMEFAGFLKDLGSDAMGSLEDFNQYLVGDVGWGGTLGEGFQEWGDRFGGAADWLEKSFASPTNTYPGGMMEGMAMPAVSQSDANSMVAEENFQALANSYTTWDTMSKITLLAAFVRDTYEAEGQAGLKREIPRLTGLVSEMETDETVRSSLTDLVNGVADEAAKGYTPGASSFAGEEYNLESPARPGIPSQTQGVAALDLGDEQTSNIKTVTDEVVSIAGDAQDREVLDAVAENEAAQPYVDGRPILDYLSGTNRGKQQIYEGFKTDQPMFKLMNPNAQNIYNNWEQELRSQYNIEISNPASPWFGGTDVGGGINNNYRDYLEAAFDPNNRTAALWDRATWQQKLDNIYQLAGYGPEGGMVDSLTNTDNIQTTSEIMGPIFEGFAQDPETVKNWIIYKSMKGANPIVARYGPAAVNKHLDKWITDNTKIMNIGITEQPGTSDAETQLREAEKQASRSLFNEWASRDFKWFGDKGYASAGR